MNRIVPVIVGLAFAGAGGYMVYTQIRLFGTEGMWLEPVVWAGGLFGLLGLFTVVRALRRRALRTEASPSEPSAPWTVREEWRTDVLEAQSTIQKSLLFFAVLWNAVSWPVAYFVLSGTIEGEGEPWFVVLFPLVGLGLIGAVVWQVVKARKFGPTRLKMDTMPGRLGQVLDAVVKTDIDASERPDGGFEVSLSCYRQYVTYSRDSDGDTEKKVRRDLKWRDEKVIRPRVGANNKLEIPVSIRIPSDASPSTLQKTEQRMLWELEASADVPGIDYEATFEIPVLEPEEGAAADEAETLESEPDAEGEVFWTVGDEDAGLVHAEPSETSETGEREGAYAAYDASDDFTKPVSDGIHMRRKGSGVEFEFESGRNTTGVVVMGIIGVVFVSVGGLMIVNGAWIWGLVFVGAAGAGGYAALYAHTFASTVTVANGTVRVVSGAFGKENQQVFSAAQLADVKVTSSGKSGDDYYYRMTLHPVSEDVVPELKRRKDAQESIEVFIKGTGAKETKVFDKGFAAAFGQQSPGVKVADGLSNKAEADWIANQIIRAAERENRF